MVLQRHRLQVSIIKPSIHINAHRYEWFRLAIDLDLNRPPSVKPTDERSEREILNRLRTYVVCYIMDRCFCINLGKAFMVPEDEVTPSFKEVDPPV